jgi:hypothetical protein
VPSSGLVRQRQEARRPEVAAAGRLAAEEVLAHIQQAAHRSQEEEHRIVAVGEGSQREVDHMAWAWAVVVLVRRRVAVLVRTVG